jgi:methionyl-tRNA synthetase
MTVKTPTCPWCKAKFSGDPCSKCGRSHEVAVLEKSARMPGATRRRRKHGRR